METPPKGETPNPQPNTPQPTNTQPERVKYEIPVEGSLGLLALGHVGLKLWRDKRREHNQAIMAKRKLNQKPKTDLDGQKDS